MLYNYLKLGQKLYFFRPINFFKNIIISYLKILLVQVCVSYKIREKLLLKISKVIICESVLITSNGR